MKPSYYAVIPAEVRYSDIPPNAKLLYGEISALTSKDGYCWASNQYFADLYKVNKTTISDWIKCLIDSGFIYSQIENNTERKIYLNPSGKAEAPFGKSRRDPSGKAEHINTVSITTNTSEADASQVYVVVADKEEKPRKTTPATSVISSLFLKATGKQPPLNWKTNRTIKLSAENLLAERGEEKILNALKFYMEHKDEPFCPSILTPWDLDTKWEQLLAFKKKVS